MRALKGRQGLTRLPRPGILPAVRLNFPCSRGLTTVLMPALLLSAAASASDVTVQPGIYEIVARIVMPHLEENLRYTATRERRCLQADDLSSLFPVLQHPAFSGCKLRDEGRLGDAVRYLLVCQSPHVATGTAQFQISPIRITGVLDIKMGGKNMTFAQHIEATRQSGCELLP